MADYQDLPNEIRFKIYVQLDYQDLSNLSQVNKDSNEILENEFFWKSLLLEDFPLTLNSQSLMINSYKEYYHDLYRELYEIINSFIEYIQIENKSTVFDKLKIINEILSLFKNYRKCPTEQIYHYIGYTSEKITLIINDHLNKNKDVDIDTGIFSSFLCEIAYHLNLNYDK